MLSFILEVGFLVLPKVCCFPPDIQEYLSSLFVSFYESLDESLSQDSLLLGAVLEVVKGLRFELKCVSLHKFVNRSLPRHVPFESINHDLLGFEPSLAFKLAFFSPDFDLESGIVLDAIEQPSFLHLYHGSYSLHP